MNECLQNVFQTWIPFASLVVLGAVWGQFEKRRIIVVSGVLVSLLILSLGLCRSVHIHVDGVPGTDLSLWYGELRSRVLHQRAIKLIVFAVPFSVALSYGVYYAFCAILKRPVKIRKT